MGTHYQASCYVLGQADLDMALCRRRTTRYSHVSTDCPPWIFITISPQSLSETNIDHVDALWAWCDRLKLDVNVEVTEEVLSLFQVQDLFRSPPTVGKSIGIVEIPRSAGTAGGHIKLKKDGHPDKICALSCHHVIAPDDQSNC
jgi:hypothetical protein